MILEINDVMDELILPVVQHDKRYLQLADEYINYLIRSFDSTKSIDDIPTPVPFKVKELANAYVCYRVCFDKFGGQVGVMFKGADGTDRWYSKLKFYQEQFEELQNSMTADVMTGEAPKGKSSNVIPLWRG